MLTQEVGNMGQMRRSLTREFKSEAVKLVIESGRHSRQDGQAVADHHALGSSPYDGSHDNQVRESPRQLNGMVGNGAPFTWTKGSEKLGWP